MRLIFCKPEKANALCMAIIKDLGIELQTLPDKDHIHKLKGHEHDTALAKTGGPCSFFSKLKKPVS